MPVATAALDREVKFEGPPYIFFSNNGNTASRTVIPASQRRSAPAPRVRQATPSASESQPTDPFFAPRPKRTPSPAPLVLPRLRRISYETESDSPSPRQLAEKRISRLEQLKRSLRDSIERASGVQTAQAAYDRAQAELDRLSGESNQLPLCTEGYGIVSKCLCQDGQRVAKGDNIFELIDSRTQYVSSLIPSRQIDSIKSGMKVSLYFPGEQRRRGRINSLPVRTTERDYRGESMVEIRVEPMGALWPTVPIGSEVRVAFD